MARSYLFGISCGWGAKKQTIKEVAEDFWNCCFQLSKVDDIFCEPVFSKENFKEVRFKVDGTSKSTVVESMAKTILKFSETDIKTYEKDINPDINYSRDFGFSWVASFKNDDGKDCFSLSVSMGSAKWNGISTLTFSREYNKEFAWYFKVLGLLIALNDAKIGGVNLRGSEFLNAIGNVKRPLGWITYISNDYEIPIPDDLEGIEYEHTDKGKYLILTREDFTTDKETYEAHKQKLLDTMEEIKRRVPEYGK